MGAAQFGSAFFMITGFHGTHVSIGVIFLIIVAIKVWRGDLDRQTPGFLTGRKGNYEIVETWACIGTSSIWCGYSSSRFSIFGRGNRGARRGAHQSRTQSGNTVAHVEGQQHPIGIYLKIWALLFVLSAASYMVDYFQFQGYLRWFLIVVFMMMKAGLIVAVFMHMLWERLALMYAILFRRCC